MASDGERQIGSTIGAGALRVAADRGLTQTEALVLQQLVDGLSPMEIAVAQDISIATVRTHIARLHQKCGVHRTLDLVRLTMAGS